MLYEEKREKVGLAVRDVGKMVSAGKSIVLDTRKIELKGILIKEIEAILTQFDESNKIKIVSKVSNEPFSDMYFEDEPRAGMSYTIQVIDLPYFDSFLPPKPYVNPFTEMTNIITGTTPKERAELEAIRNSYKQPKAIVKTIKEPNNVFFIEFKDDGVIKLNGKIDIGKPEFNGTNEAIFIFLFNNPNISFTKSEVIEGAKIKSIQDFHKVVENLGFRRGLKKAFFDINKGSIKFKNPVTL